MAVGELGGARFRSALWVVLAATLVVVSVVALRVRAGRLGGPPPPVLATLPDFALHNRDGRLVTRADLAGEPWIASFIFTRCRGVCPRITERLVRLGEEWDLPGRLPRRVSFSVDPDYDRAEVLAEYAGRAGARDERWLFLTGERQAVYTLVRRGFLLAVEPQGSPNPEEPIIHSTRLALVDGQGRLRGTYDAFDETAIAALRRDAARLGVER